MSVKRSSFTQSAFPLVRQVLSFIIELMKTTNLLLFTSFFLLVLLLVTLQKQLRDKILNKISSSLENNDFVTFDQITKSLLARLLIPSFDLQCLRLNAAFLRKDTDYADKVIREFDLLDLSNAQKEDVYLRIFNYYMSEKDYDKAKRYKDNILRELKDKELKKQTVAIYDIYALNSGEHVAELLESLEGLPEHQRGYTEMLIADSYRNLNDNKNARKYKDLSLRHFEQLKKEIERNK